MSRALSVAACACVLAFLAVGCGRTSLPCGPNTCDGCCTVDDACVPGTSVTACGRAGVACEPCVRPSSSQFATCIAQTCNSSGSSSGGGGSFGGGASGGGAFGGGSFGGGAFGGGISDGGGSAGGGSQTGGGTGIPVPLTQVIPGIVYLVDNSGSMMLPVDPMSPQCPMGCGQSSACPMTCTTRSQRVKSTFAQLTARLRTSASQALVTFPITMGFNQCGPAGVSVPLQAATDAAALQNQATSVSTAVQALVPSGGTPTASAITVTRTMNFMSVPAQRETFAVLVTDGRPNCNPNNPENECNGATSCVCTVGTNPNSCRGPFCALGCADNTVTTAAQQLAQIGVKLLVVSVGPDAQQLDTLSALTNIGINGQLLRECSMNTHDCGPNGVCGASGNCVVGTYTLNTMTETQLTTDAIERHVNELGRCRFVYPSGQLPSRLTLNGHDVPHGNPGWQEDSDQVHLTVTGTDCDTLIATSAQPVAVR